MEHIVLVGSGEPKPGIARILALTAMITLACQSKQSGEWSRLGPIYITYHGSLGFSLGIEIVHEFPHVYPVYETININAFEAFEYHNWNPKHSDCDASHEGRVFKISTPLAQ
jgi:hypothetical protein